MELESVVRSSSDLESEPNDSIVCKSFSITDMPAELLYDIAGYLPLTTIARLCTTCKRLQAVLDSELYKQDCKRGIFRTLSWAVYSLKPEAPTIIERALNYWPPGCDALHCYLRKENSNHEKKVGNFTPLIAAVKACNHRVVALLISKGVNIHHHERRPKLNQSLWYPIHHAVMMDHGFYGEKPYTTEDKFAVIKLLLSNGADPNQLTRPFPYSYALAPGGILTPMHLAIINNADSRLIDLLLNSGASATRFPECRLPNQRFRPVTPISHMINTYTEATESHYLVVKSLIAHGAGKGIEAQRHTMSRYPLLFESLWRPRKSPYSVAITKELLAKTSVKIVGAQYNGESVIVFHLRNHINWKPSVEYDRRLVLRHEEFNDMASVARTTCDTIGVLLEFGANINEVGNLGVTPLHIAGGLHCGYRRIFDYLLMKGANVKATTSNGLTVLHMLVMGDQDADHTLVSRLVKQYKLDRYAKDKDGNMFLHHLCVSKVTSLCNWMGEVAMLYKKEDFDDPKLRNNAGRTPYEAALSQSVLSSESGRMLQFWIHHAFKDAEEKKRATTERYREHYHERKSQKKWDNPKKSLPERSWKQKM